MNNGWRQGLQEHMVWVYFMMAKLVLLWGERLAKADNDGIRDDC